MHERIWSGFAEFSSRRPSMICSAGQSARSALRRRETSKAVGSSNLAPIILHTLDADVFRSQALPQGVDLIMAKGEPLLPSLFAMLAAS
jgi:hypothetical protein